jgi:hypothetical protein
LKANACIKTINDTLVVLFGFASFGGNVDEKKNVTCKVGHLRKAKLRGEKAQPQSTTTTERRNAFQHKIIPLPSTNTYRYFSAAHVLVDATVKRGLCRLSFSAVHRSGNRVLHRTKGTKQEAHRVDDQSTHGNNKRNIFTRKKK